jgi:acetyltransferase-like isoleucine patch superfamily enzyme
MNRFKSIKKNKLIKKDGFVKIRHDVLNLIKDQNINKLEFEINKNFKIFYIVNPFKYFRNKFIFTIQKLIPPYKWKNSLLRLTGMKIGKDVCIPHYIHFDPFFPELISIDAGSLVGGLSKFYNHKIENGKLIVGKINIDKFVLLAGLTTIYPGVKINTHVITGMKSVITKDCPKNTFIVGNDLIKKEWSKEDLERLFYKSKNDQNYYSNFKKQVKEFRKDKNMMSIRILNDGKRLNPGNEWYLSRPTWRIYYNAIWVELGRLSLCEVTRDLFNFMLGVKKGKNVKIAKGTVFDHIYGDFVELGNNVIIGKNCYLDGHSYTIGETIFGRIKIGNNTILEDDVYVSCGIKIGNNCKILKNSSVIKNIPDNETWGGNPAKKIER